MRRFTLGGPASGQSSSGPLIYEYSDGDVTVRKTFRPDKEFLLSVEIEVTRNGQRVQAFPQWPSGLGDQLAPVPLQQARLTGSRTV